MRSSNAVFQVNACNYGAYQLFNLRNLLTPFYVFDEYRLLRSSSQSFFRLGKDNSQAFSSSGEFSGHGGYFSSVFSSVKQKATILKWSQVDSSLANDVAPRFLEIERDELPLSSQITDDQAVVVESMSDNFEKFKSEQEAKLKEWLEEA